MENAQAGGPPLCLHFTSHYVSCAAGPCHWRDLIQPGPDSLRNLVLNNYLLESIT